MTDGDFTEDDLVQLALLRDEETDALVEAGFLDPDSRMESPLDHEISFDFPELTLNITPGPHYPLMPLEHLVINHSLSRTDVDGLRGRFRDMMQEAETTNSFQRWVDRETSNAWGIFDGEKLVLKMVREAENSLKAIRARSRPEEYETNKLPFLMKKPVSALSSSEMALRYLGKTAQEIIEIVPAEFRVLHIEEVIRGDLGKKFYSYQDNLREQLSTLSLRHLRRFVPGYLQHSQHHADLVEHLVTPKMTFHGTQRQYVSSIVRFGFLKPGMTRPDTGEEHGVRCGSTYGRGIYSSPSAVFSLSYSNWWCEATKPNEFFGLKLLVCATIMGRTRLMLREDNWREQEDAYQGADSHVANRSLEYIVFNPAQIIPIYVIHLDWGQHNLSHFYDLPADPKSWTWTPPQKTHHRLNQDTQYAGDKQRAKQAVLAKAAKYFPYGYGPVTGGKFVVEEVGEVSDDEEEYGDYQAMRVQENEDKSASTNFWSWVKAAEEEEEAERGPVADEYRVYKGFRPQNWDDIATPEQEPRGEDDDEDFGLSALHVGEGESSAEPASS